MLKPSDLSQFSGTETWMRHALNRNMLYTEGVEFFAEQVGGYWMLDIVATSLMALHGKHHFLGIELRVNDKREAELYADDGNDHKLYSRRIEFTDCPEGVWKFFLIDNVLLLRSEY